MSLPKWLADSEDESHKDIVTEKNVVELLYDHARQARQKVSFVWDFVGTTSLPGFICKLTVGDAVYIGAGSSKKSAKYSAAKAALDVKVAFGASASEPSAKDVLTSDGQNPISVLHALVAMRKMPLPDYVVVTEQIIGGRTAYTMGCRVGDLMEKGSGLCKKTAKQEASLKMLEKLKEEDKPERVPDPRPDQGGEPLSTAPGRAKSIRVRVSPYPGTTRPFPENRRGGSAHPFNTTPGKNELYPPRSVLPNTRQLRESGYGVQGALNTDTTRPPMGNQRCHSTQEFNRGPIVHAQYPSAQEFNREAIAHSQYPLAQVLSNTVPIRPHMELRQDRNAPEMHPLLGHNVQFNTRPLQESGYDVKGALNTDTTRPPMGNQRCHSSQEFNRGLIVHAQFPSAQEFNRKAIAHSQYPLAQVLSNTEPIRPHMELRQDRNAPEMHPSLVHNVLGHNVQSNTRPLQESGYDVKGALNIDTTRPPIGNKRCHSTQEFNRGPIVHAQYPSAQEFNREAVAHSQYPLAQIIPNTELIRPHMALWQDRSLPETHPALGHNAQHQCIAGPLNTATVRPLMGNHHSAQELGGNARFSLTPASLSSGLVRILLASQQDVDAQGLNSTEGCEEEYIWARVSKITGTAALFLEQKANLKPVEMSAGPESNAGLKGTFVTLKPAGTLELPLEQLEDPISPERNTAPGTNAGCSLSSSNLIPHRLHLDDHQKVCENATWAQFSMSHPRMF